MHKLRRFTLVCAVLAPALAFADKTAPQWFDEGENQYNLGNFQAAVDAFKKGYEAEPDAHKKLAYIYNIAQSYRQGNDCTNSVFFYKRYLSLKDADTVKPWKTQDERKEVVDTIADLEECVKKQASIKERKPDNPIKPDGANPDPTKDPAKDPNKRVAVKDPPDGPDGPHVVKTATKPASVISARVIGGGAKITAGDLPVPVQANLGLIAGYPLRVNDQISIDLGVGFTLTPVPFEDAMHASQSAQFIATMVDVGPTFHANDKLGIRADLGLGLLFLGGVSNSPFTDFAETSGALSMFHLRAGVSADYAITPNVIATIAPFAFSYSPPKDGLRKDITSITSIDFMVGLGYRM